MADGGGLEGETKKPAIAATPELRLGGQLNAEQTNELAANWRLASLKVRRSQRDRSLILFV